MIKYIRDNFIRFFDGPEGGGAGNQKKIAPASGALNRSDAYKAALEEWKATGKPDELLNNLLKNFLNGGPPQDAGFQIDMHISPGANGFSITGLKPLETDQFRFLMDLFKARLVNLKYRPYSSTFEEKNRGDKLIRYERHYLKPGVFSEQPPMEQLYGNMLLELELSNGQVDYLKLLATYYTGYDYKPAGNFDELVRIILG